MRAFHLTGKVFDRPKFSHYLLLLVNKFTALNRRMEGYLHFVEIETFQLEHTIKNTVYEYMNTFPVTWVDCRIF